MQKKIIAVAVAALASTAAFAQTNVTVYGVVDVQQAFVKSSNGASGVNQTSVGRLDSHGNYIGFKGVEDLGNGLKAVFVYETAISADAGGAFSGTRDSYIGLAGGFGTVAAGNLTHPLRAFGAKVELLPGAAGFGTMASLTGTIAGLKTGADDRASNAVAYISPSFGGFTAIGAYVNGENKPSSSVNSKAWQLAGQYENGPLFVGAGYHRANDATFKAATAATFATSTDPLFVDAGGNVGVVETKAAAAAIAADKARVIRVVAAYTFPSNTKLTALYDNTKTTGTTGAGAAELKRQAYSLGVAQGFGKNTVGLEFARANKLKADGNAVADSSANIVTALYGYELSKRTMLHARYSRLANQAGTNTNFYNLPVSNGVAGSNGSDYTGFSVGLRHSF